MAQVAQPLTGPVSATAHSTLTVSTLAPTNPVILPRVNKVGSSYPLFKSLGWSVSASRICPTSFCHCKRNFPTSLPLADLPLATFGAMAEICDIFNEPLPTLPEATILTLTLTLGNVTAISIDIISSIPSERVSTDNQEDH